MRYARETAVPVDRSRAEIEKTLIRFGAGAFAYAWDGSANAAVVMFEFRKRRVKFVIPMPARSIYEKTEKGRKRPGGESAVNNAWEQAIRQRWRALCLVIKAKLEAVESGVLQFEDEFLAHVVMPDGKTVGEHIRPAIELAYQNGKMPPLLLGFGGGEKK